MCIKLSVSQMTAYREKLEYQMFFKICWTILFLKRCRFPTAKSIADVIFLIIPFEKQSLFVKNLLVFRGQYVNILRLHQLCHLMQAAGSDHHRPKIVKLFMDKTCLMLHILLFSQSRQIFVCIMVLTRNFQIYLTLPIYF